MPADRRTARVVAIALGALTALGLVLRLVGVDQTLYADENFTYSIVTRNGLAGVWHDVYHTSITPPLHYYLAWLSVHFGGDRPALVRLPSIVFGTALVPLVFLLGRRIGGARGGLVAAAIIALGPFAIWYSDEARNYATMMFLVALSTLALLRALEGGGRRWWVVYALAACAALYSHYTAVFVVVAQAAWGLWTHPAHRRASLVAAGAIVVGYLPWVPGFLNQRQNKGGIEIIGNLSPLTPSAPFRLPLQTLVGHPFFGLSRFPGRVGLVLLALAALTAVTLLRRRPGGFPGVRGATASEAGLLVALSLVTTLGLLVYAAGGTSLFLPRNLSASLPALAAVTAAGLAWLTRRVPTHVAVAALALLVLGLAVNALKSLRDPYRRPPYREAARYVESIARPGDPLVEIPLALALDPRVPPTTLGLYLRHPHPLFRAGFDEPAWSQLTAGRDVFLVTSHQFVPGAFAQSQLQPGEQLPPGLLARLTRLGGPDGRARRIADRTFPGVFSVDVLRFRGRVDGRLHTARGRGVISWSFGRRILVSPGAATGEAEHAAHLPRATRTVVGGWAVDVASRRPADWILFFRRGRLLAVTAGGSRRPDIAARYGPGALFAGWAAQLLPAGDPAARIRAFAVTGDRASEISFRPQAAAQLR